MDFSTFFAHTVDCHWVLSGTQNCGSGWFIHRSEAHFNSNICDAKFTSSAWNHRFGSPCIIDLINWNWNWNWLVWRLTIQLKPCLYSNKYVISSLLSKKHRTMQHCTPIKWFAFKCDAPQWSAMHTELNRKPIELDATVELWLIPFNGQFSNQSIEALSDAFALILLSLRVLLKVVLKSIPHKLKLIDFEWVRFFQAISRKLHSYEWI